MNVVIRNQGKFLSIQPNGTLEWRDNPNSPGQPGVYETFEVIELGKVDPGEPVIPIIPPSEPTVVMPGEGLPPKERFFALVAGYPFNQKTLNDLEPTLNAAGWLLTPPNAQGDRTKVHPPQGPWTRVGFGEGHWVWVEQVEQ